MEGTFMLKIGPKSLMNPEFSIVIFAYLSFVKQIAHNLKKIIEKFFINLIKRG